jgi:hypothetical protein
MSFLSAMSVDEMVDLLVNPLTEDGIIAVHPIPPIESYSDSPESRGFQIVEDSDLGMNPPGEDGMGYCPTCGGWEYYKVPVKSAGEIIDWFTTCFTPNCREA